MGQQRDDTYARAARRELLVLGAGAPAVGAVVGWALLPHGTAYGITAWAVVTSALLVVLGVAYAVKRRTSGGAR